MACNFEGDTALHVAAAVLFTKRRRLLHVQNRNMETPLSKAALYGRRDMFFCLLNAGSNLNADAVTPLQLMVTIPELFRSQTPLAPLESFLYDLPSCGRGGPSRDLRERKPPRAIDLGLPQIPRSRLNPFAKRRRSVCEKLASIGKREDEEDYHHCQIPVTGLRQTFHSLIRRDRVDASKSSSTLRKLQSDGHP
ncbi:hypothetical protein OPV22_001124 [Ensete ventricosum]|uniref:Uncharacterized protein n=1 Tax=Ensete ventricosum TaxID=4639 RepID=A0AAV8RQS0_ENSVE|nr:hypothetical protein OPV22_001124 [Ensete ventricosum]